MIPASLFLVLILDLVFMDRILWIQWKCHVTRCFGLLCTAYTFFLGAIARYHGYMDKYMRPKMISTLCYNHTCSNNLSVKKKEVLNYDTGGNECQISSKSSQISFSDTRSPGADHQIVKSSKIAIDMRASRVSGHKMRNIRYVQSASMFGR